MERLRQDVRYALRTLRRNPGFTAVAVLTLAIGIGANTAVFGFVNALFVRPLPFDEPDRLVRLFGTAPEERRFDVLSYPNIADIRDQARSLAGLAPHQYTTVSLRAGDEAETVRGELVGGDYFSVLGVGPVAGRVLLPSDALVPGAHPVVVLAHSYWQRRMGGDPDVLGRTVHLNGHAFTVVGIAAPGFTGSYPTVAANFWAPLMMQQQARPRGLTLEERGWRWLIATGRLAPGVDREQANAELAAIAARLRDAYPGANGRLGLHVVAAGAVPESSRHGTAGFIAIIAAVVAAVLLVACANLAGSMLGRVVSRSHETAVRVSLGATRGRLVRLWLAESVVLSLLAGAAAILVSAWATDAIIAFLPSDSEWTVFAPDLGLDARVLAFTFAAALLAGVLFGLAPALRSAATDVAAALKTATGTAGRGRTRLRSAFVVFQTALTVVLLVGAGLLLRSLAASDAFDPGFETDGLVVAHLDLRRHGYQQEDARSFYRQAAERLPALPGVDAVTFAVVVPLGGAEERLFMTLDGYEPPDGRGGVAIDVNLVGPDYFPAMRIPILRGRGFDARDGAAGARPVVVINETMARRFWPDGDPLGRTVGIGDAPPAEVIGIAADIKYYDVAEDPRPYVYAFAGQFPASGSTLHVRVRGDAGAFVATLRRELAAIDPDVAVEGAATFAQMRAVQLFPARLLATVTAVFGLLALLLAALGLYGLISYSVAQRTREIGVRMALGARAFDVVRLVVGQGVRSAAIGLVAGLAAALAAGRLIAGFLFGVRPADPATFAGAAAVLLLVALLAAYLPARRATAVDPTIALRGE